ncbi:MAG: type IV pilus secretin PilQ [Candidatus Berkiella sp.]
MTKLQRNVVGCMILVFSLLGYTASVAAAPQDKNAASAYALQLRAVQVSSIEGNRIKVNLKLSHPITEPKNFAIENPAKIVLDLPGVKNGLASDAARAEYNLGAVRRVSVVEADNRTRVVIDLNESVPYQMSVEGSDVNIVIAAGIPAAQSTDPFSGHAFAKKIAGQFSINNIDFRRGAQSDGRVMVDLSHQNVAIELKEEGSQIRVRFANAHLPAQLQRKLDVTDFGTPVVSVNSIQQGADVEMTIKMEGYAEHIAYQADNRFTIEVRPLTKQEKDALKEKAFEYTGERLSLNFQDIEVRAVLQLIADFTGLNIVSSDTVRGSVTLRLKNVPWDQALDIIMKTKGLAKRQVGNVLLVAPTEEIAAREKLELQTSQQVADLAPLQAEYIEINYAKVADIAGLLKAENNSLLSARGAVSMDERTNTLLVQDTAQKLDEIRKLVHRLDTPVRQVLIESRVVFATDDFEDALGVKFGAAAKLRPGNEPVLGVAGSRIDLADNNFAGSRIAMAQNPSAAVAATSVAERLMVDLPAALSTGGTASLGMTVASLPGGTILDLELAALESEGLGKIVASPRIVTSNQQQAYIETGEEIPYLEWVEPTSGGGSPRAVVSFKKAVLRLEVTPQITPDDKIILDLTVNQDSRGIMTNGVPAINTREMHTKVLVSNGETVVLGGIYQQEKNEKVSKVPFLGNLPLVGWLFKNKSNLDKRNELLIFVTPKIIQEGVT